MSEKQSANQHPPHQIMPQYGYQADDDGIDLREVFGVLWAEKWLIVGVTAVAAVVSVIYALQQTDIYRAEATLAPASQQQSGSPLAAELGGAAALVGIGIPQSQGIMHIENALAVMRSRDFIIRFIHENNVLVPLFAGQWDASERVSDIDEDIYNVSSGEWLLDGGQPGDLAAYRAFNGNYSVNRDPRTSIITVAIDWHDPVLAQQWVNKLVESINQEGKAADLAEAVNAIAYLRQQLESTQLVEMRQVFYDLIESQTRVSMLADVREEYVFQVVDPALVPDTKIAPRRALISMLGTLLGGMLSIGVVFVRRMLRDQTPASPDNAIAQ